MPLLCLLLSITAHKHQHCDIKKPMMNYIFSNSKVPDNIVASVNVIIKDGFYKTKKKKLGIIFSFIVSLDTLHLCSFNNFSLLNLTQSCKKFT